MTTAANGKVQKLILSTAPEYWKARLPSVGLQHVGNKKVYETASAIESLVATSRYEFLKKSMQTCGWVRYRPSILLIENKWFVGFRGLICGVGMWNAQGTASRWVCSLKYALISWLLVEVDKSAVDCSLKALGFSC